MTGTVYTLYAREQNEKKQRKQEKRKRRKKIGSREGKNKRKNCCVSSQGMWQALHGLKQKYHYLQIYCSSKTKNQGEITGKPKHESTLQVAAVVCGTSSIITRLSVLVRLVPCYPVFRLRPAFVNNPRPSASGKITEDEAQKRRKETKEDRVRTSCAS